MTHLPRVWKGAIAEAAKAFLLSRLVIFAVLALVLQLQLESHPAREGTNFHARWSPEALLAHLEETLRSADGNWYIEIARDGYSTDLESARAKNWVFFPLLPLLLRAIEPLCGSYARAGFLLSHIALLLGLSLLYRTAEELGGNREAARRAVWIAAFFPTSYFFSSVLTESLFFALTLASFYLLLRKCALTAALVFSLATLTRPTGFLVLPGFYVFLAGLGLHRSYRGWLAVSVAPLGGAMFLLYLWHLTGDPFAFASNQQFWGRFPGGITAALYNLASEVQSLILPWNFVLLNLVAAAVALAGALHFARRREWGLALTVAIPVIIALKTGTVLSLARFVLALFPLYIALADRCGERGEIPLLLIFTALLVLLTAGYALHITAAMA